MELAAGRPGVGGADLVLDIDGPGQSGSIQITVEVHLAGSSRLGYVWGLILRLSFYSSLRFLENVDPATFERLLGFLINLGFDGMAWHHLRAMVSGIPSCLTRDIQTLRRTYKSNVWYIRMRRHHK